MTIAVWRDISLVWLVFLTLLAVLPWGVVFFFLVKGMAKVRQGVKKIMPILQAKANQVARGADQASYKIAQPVVGAHALGAQVGTITRTVFRRN